MAESKSIGSHCQVIYLGGFCEFMSVPAVMGFVVCVLLLSASHHRDTMDTVVFSVFWGWGVVDGRCLPLSDGRSCDSGKENTGPVSGPPLVTPPPNKRRCTGPLKECVEEIREANGPVLKCTALKKQEVTT